MTKPQDDEARVAFEVRTMQEWFDWEPRYTRMQRAPQTFRR